MVPVYSNTFALHINCALPLFRIRTELLERGIWGYYW